MRELKQNGLDLFNILNGEDIYVECGSRGGFGFWKKVASFGTASLVNMIGGEQGTNKRMQIQH